MQLLRYTPHWVFYIGVVGLVAVGQDQPISVKVYQSYLSDALSSITQILDGVLVVEAFMAFDHFLNTS